MEFLDLFGVGDWLIQSVTNVLRKASFWLCEQVYPLIPKLYEIVEVLAKYTFFTDETINKISRNIYILVSVLMLFALGTKLLSAIVNPENFSGDKGSKGKSFKATFFRSVIAVFLIILTPMFFNTAYDVQKHVIDNSLVERILLGVDLEGDTSGGQILAGYSFVTFCHPWDGDTTTEEFFNETINKDIKYISFLEDKINEEDPDLGGDGIKNYVETAVEKAQEIDSYDGKALYFNGLLCPAVGILIVYELILLAMDLGLRSVKLGLLQLMSPIVIASYIFKGEILSKWFKEVITTYLICFLKIAAITFMVFGMTELSGFLSRPELDPLSAGAKRITQLFIMIGLLQVIKLIPNIINGIFGTNIQSRGGIKGRLGEMAAVGGLAQKAWDALKTPATKIAGLGLAAAGLGPLGLLGAGAAGWAAHKTWNKGWGNKGPLKDTKFGRVARTIGAGGSAVGTALTTKGGLFKSIGAGMKKYDESAIGKQTHVQNKELGAKQRADQKLLGMRRLAGIDDEGKVKPKTKEDMINHLKDPNIGTTAIDEYRKAAAGDAVLDKTKKNITEEAVVARGRVDAVEKIASSRDAMARIAESLANSAEMRGDFELAAKLKGVVAGLDAEKGNIKLHKASSIIRQALNTSNSRDLMTADLDQQLTGHQDQISDFLTFMKENYTSKVIGADGTYEKNKDGSYKRTKIDTDEWTSEKLKSMTTSFGIQKNDAEAELNIIKNNADPGTKAEIEDLENIGAGLTKQPPKYTEAERLSVTPSQQPTPQPTPQPQPAPQQTQTDSVYDNPNTVPSTGETTQQIIERVNNVSDGPTREEHDERQDYYNRFFNDSAVSNTVDAAERVADGNADTSQSQNINLNGGSVNGANINVTADVDLKELSNKLDQVNQSITSAGNQVSSAVNDQGNKISEGIGKSNEELGKISKASQTIQNRINSSDDDDDE